jgi:hypothetical protein
MEPNAKRDDDFINRHGMMLVRLKQREEIEKSEKNIYYTFLSHERIDPIILNMEMTSSSSGHSDSWERTSIEYWIGHTAGEKRNVFLLSRIELRSLDVRSVA